MARPRKLEGTHQFLNMLVCDRCGHKVTGLDQIARSVMKDHLAAKHPEAVAPSAPGGAGEPTTDRTET